MSYDLHYIKGQVRRAIEAAPTRINVTRDEWVSDGYGGKKRGTKGGSILSGATCLFDNATGPDLLSNATDAGRIFAQNGVRIFIMYDDGAEIKPADTITVIQSSRRYRVVEVHNILEQNIVIELRLEVKD